MEKITADPQQSWCRHKYLNTNARKTAFQGVPLSFCCNWWSQVLFSTRFVGFSHSLEIPWENIHRNENQKFRAHITSPSTTHFTVRGLQARNPPQGTWGPLSKSILFCFPNSKPGKTKLSITIHHCIWTRLTQTLVFCSMQSINLQQKATVW